MSARYLVGPSDRTVGDVLERAPGGAVALSEGRVFVGRVRVKQRSLSVSPGDEVLVHPPREEPGGVRVRVLGEWQGLVALYKPADLPTEPDRQGGTSLLRAAARLLGLPEADLHAATRLDAPVSGIVVVARGPDGKRLVRALQDQGRLHRRYVALLAGVPEPSQGVVDLPIGRDARGRPSAGGRDARSASTRFRRLAALPGGLASMALFEPVTGRTHQIRIHAASMGTPILGDAEHGGPRRLVLPTGTVIPLPAVCLHAARIAVTGPGDETVWSLVAPVPGEFIALWRALGGAAGDLQDVLGSPEDAAVDGRRPG